MNEQSSSVTIEDKQETLIGKVCNPWTWRLANGFMALFFAFATYVQVSVPHFEFIFDILRTRQGKSVAISSFIYLYYTKNGPADKEDFFNISWITKQQIRTVTTCWFHSLDTYIEVSKKYVTVKKIAIFDIIKSYVMFSDGFEPFRRLGDVDH